MKYSSVISKSSQEHKIFFDCIVS